MLYTALLAARGAACCAIEYAPEMVAWEAITVAIVASPTIG